MREISRQEFINNIQNNVSTVAASRRLASTLNRQAAGKSLVWPTFSIFTLQQFVLKQIEKQVFLGVLPAKDFLVKILESLEQELLWHKIIQKQENFAPLINVSQIAKYARAAHVSLQEFMVESKEGGFEYGKFKSWHGEYEKYCMEHNVSDFERIFNKLCNIDTNFKFWKLATVQFAGFSEITPLLAGFARSLEQNGVVVLKLKDETGVENVCYKEYAGPKDELNAMAAWCGEKIRQEPNAKIAILSNQLSSEREAIVNALSSALHPEYPALCYPENSKFNISLGRKLTEHELIKTALGLLELVWLDDKFDYQFISCLLTSRNLPRDSLIERTEFDLYFREHTASKSSFAELIKLMQQAYVELPEWAENLKNLAKLKSGAKPKLELWQWADYFIRCLQTIGLAKAHKTSVFAQQLLISINKAMDKFAGFEFADSMLGADKACKLFRKICESQVFQAETSHAANIEVMSVEESEGLLFDYVWVLGADSHSLPAEPRPNPLLPIMLQRKYAMPFASIDKNLAAANSLVARLKTCGRELIFSFGKLHETKEVLPSSLLLESAKLEFGKESANINNPEALEELDDYRGSMLAGGKLKSAIGFLRNQAVCPLMAYALHRLKLKQPPIPEPWFSPLKRGQLMHRILEKIYGIYKNKSSLTRLDPERLESIIAQQLQKALPAVGTNALELEKLRVLNAILSWLELDSSRDNFVVLEREQSLSLNLAGFEFVLRLDRVDMLDDGSIVIVDYKTGQTSKTGWFDERLSEPQLPLYAINTEQAAAIAYAEVKPTAAALKHWGKVRLTNTKNSTVDAKTWNGRLNIWQLQLENLLHEIGQGFAPLLLERPDKILSSDARGFCRLQEQK